MGTRLVKNVKFWSIYFGGVKFLIIAIDYSITFQIHYHYYLKFLRFSCFQCGFVHLKFFIIFVSIYEKHMFRQGKIVSLYEVYII